MEKPDSELTLKQTYARRSFLSRSCVVISSALVSPALITTSVPAAPSQPQVGKFDSLYIYGRESGNLTNSGYFVVGFLMTRKADEHADYIRGLRQKHRFFTELRYGNLNIFKKKLANDLIDYFFKEPDLTFAARVVDYKWKDSAHRRGGTRRRGAMTPQRQIQRDEYYYQAYKTLITENTPQEGSLAINLINHRVTEDLILHKYLKELPKCKGLNITRSYDSDLIQMAGFFTGSIHGDAIRGGEKPYGDNDLKPKLISKLKEHLGVSNLINSALSRSPKFRVSILRPQEVKS